MSYENKFITYTNCLKSGQSAHDHSLIRVSVILRDLLSLNFLYLFKHHKHLYKQWLILHTFIQRDSEGSLSTFFQGTYLVVTYVQFDLTLCCQLMQGAHFLL